MIVGKVVRYYKAGENAVWHTYLVVASSDDNGEVGRVTITTFGQANMAFDANAIVQQGGAQAAFNKALDQLDGLHPSDEGWKRVMGPLA